jgi:hypothetical protein
VSEKQGLLGYKSVIEVDDAFSFLFSILSQLFLLPNAILLTSNTS